MEILSSITQYVLISAAGNDVLASGDVAASSGTGGLVFQPGNFVSSLSLMGRGMLAIFVTIAIIVVVTMIINKIKDKKSSNE